MSTGIDTHVSEASEGAENPSENATSVEITMIMCGPMVGISGGDQHALRFVAEYDHERPRTVRLIAPPAVAQHLPETAARSILPLRTPLDFAIRSLPVYAVVVVIRMLLTAIRVPRSSITIASTHFFHDVIPCLVAKKRHGSAIAVFIYHLIEDMGRERSLRSAVSQAAERFSLSLLRRYADVIFVDNAEVESSLARKSFAPARIKMTGNAFDPLIPLPPRTRSAHPSVVFCGRFVEEKGIWVMLELARELSGSIPEATVEMIGDGPLHEEFSRRLDASGLTNIKLHGFVSEEEKWALLRRAALFAAPSREEGWGIAVGEALTAGVPVLAYDLPAYEYLGDLIKRVSTGDEKRFVQETTALLADRDRLDEITSTLTETDGRLPRWSDILKPEFEALREFIPSGR